MIGRPSHVGTRQTVGDIIDDDGGPPLALRATDTRPERRMDGTQRLRRRYTILLVISLAFLAGGVVLFFRMGSGLTRWLVVLGWCSISLVWWERRRALPRNPDADRLSRRAN